MSEKNTGGPAFPHPDYLAAGWEGMTLRDYFAAKAIDSIMRDDRCNSYKMAAIAAYEMADSMMKARES